MSTTTVEATTARRDDPPAAEPRTSRMKGILPVAGMYVGSIAVALAICAILVASTGGSASKVMAALLDGSLRSPGAWGLTITTAAPLLVVAVGTLVAQKAGMTNIGQEGQLILGAGVTAYCATRLGLPTGLTLLISFLAAAVFGALWAALAAVMRFTRKVPEVMSTLLLGFIAAQITTFALTKQWLLLTTRNVNRTNNGEPLPPEGKLPLLRLFGNQISYGAIIAILLTLVIAFVMTRTTTGFRLRMLGMNQRTAQRAGVSVAFVGGTALAVSGATAALAGGLWLTGGAGGDRFTAGISSNLGWQGLLVALLARERAMLAIPMAFVFAALRTGSGFLAATGVDRRIADVVQAMLVLALLVPPAIQAFQLRRSGGGS